RRPCAPRVPVVWGCHRELGRDCRTVRGESFDPARLCGRRETHGDTRMVRSMFGSDNLSLDNPRSDSSGSDNLGSDTVSAPAVASPSPLLSRPGAVAGEGVDAAVAAHYGDPLREQRLLVEGLAVLDLSHRGVLTIAGPDRISWLNSITTQLLTGLTPRTSAETLVLTPKGGIEHDL